MAASIASLSAFGVVASLNSASADARQGSVEEFPNAIPGGAGGATLRLAPGADGQMWATEAGGKIVRFASTGAITGEFGARTGAEPGMPETSHPEGIAVTPSGEVWFTDTGTNSEGHAFIGKITPSYEVLEFKIPATGLLPHAIAEGSDGNMWFTLDGASGGGTIARITSDGTITEFEVPTGGLVSTSHPGAIALGSDGAMWFTGGQSTIGFRGLIGRITTDGKITEVPTPILWGFPTAVARGSDGDMWFTETEGHVIRITPEGEMTPFPVVTTSASLGGIALGPDGNIWFAEDERTNAITRISPDGGVTEFSPIAQGRGYPTAIAFDSTGNLWFGEAGEGKIGRWTTPRTAVSEIPPELSGSPMQGQTLSVTTGLWAYEPDNFSYQWQSCTSAGDQCSDLVGETGVEHYLTANDVGHTLRVVVTAISLGGSISALSNVSQVVEQASAPAQSVPVTLTKRPTIDTPPPTVGTTMTWRFAWSQSYALVKFLAVHGIPDGGLVRVTCDGHSCPFARYELSASARGHSCRGRKCKKSRPVVSDGELNVATLFKTRHLRVGVRISVAVTKPGWTGKLFTFTVRTSRPPVSDIRCLAAGSPTVSGGC